MNGQDHVGLSFLEEIKSATISDVLLKLMWKVTDVTAIHGKSSVAIWKARGHQV